MSYIQYCIQFLCKILTFRQVTHLPVVNNHAQVSSLSALTGIWCYTEVWLGVPVWFWNPCTTGRLHYILLHFPDSYGFWTFFHKPIYRCHTLWIIFSSFIHHLLYMYKQSVQLVVDFWEISQYWNFMTSKLQLFRFDHLFFSIKHSPTPQTHTHLSFCLQWFTVLYLTL